MSIQLPRFRAVLLLALSALGVFACSTTPPKPPPSVAPRVSSSDWIHRAYAALAADDNAAANTDFEQAIQSPGFFMLAPDTRYALLAVASRTALRSGDIRKAHALIARATRYEHADSGAWLLRLYTAIRSHDDRDAATSLTEIARRWPSSLHAVFPGFPLQLHRRLQREHADQADRTLLDALFDAHWPRHVDGADYLWRDLAILHLQAGDLPRATRVALDVRQPMLVLSMRVDRRFASMVRRHPGAFNLQHLLAREIRRARARVKEHPHQLAPVQALQNLYIRAGKFQQAIHISDPILKRIRDNDGTSTYTDFQAKYNWILDNRARALAHQGHWKRATHMMELASRQTEFGDKNVSQTINLASYYARTDQPSKATAALARVGKGMSPFGRFQLERVKLEVAFDRHDKIAIKRHLAYLRTHRKLAINSWQDILLLTGNLDEAAQLLITRLNKSAWRSDALLDVQEYPDVPETFIDKRIDRNWDRVKARRDVLAAVHKVGRIEHVRIMP